MSFLRKHYEKIILAGFLLVFILALIYLIMVFSKSTETTEKDLTLIKRTADYQAKFNEVGEEEIKDPKKQQFACIRNLKEAKGWVKSENRNPNGPFYTDLTTPIEAARCPECEKIVPIFYFEKKMPCPLCGCSLKPPKTPPPVGDKDKDGILDTYEMQNKLNPGNPSDKMEDKDNDGFPNFVEFKAEPQTKANDAKSHPPIITRLYLTKITRARLPIQLLNVLSRGKEDKSKWLIQVKVFEKRRWRAKFPKLGDTIKLGDKGIYKIIDVIYKTEEKFDRSLGVPKEVNVSEIIIQNTINKKDKPITVKIKRKVYENLVKITLVDFFTNKRYVVRIGDSFTVGGSKTGMEKYVVLSVDKTTSVTVKDEKGKKYTILRKSALESEIEAIESAEGEKEKKRAPADKKL